MKEQYVLNQLKNLEEELADVCELEKSTFELNTLIMLVYIAAGVVSFSVPIILGSICMTASTLMRLIEDNNRIGMIKKRIQNEKDHLSNLSNNDCKVDKVEKRNSVLNKLVKKRIKSDKWNKAGKFASSLVRILAIFSFGATIFNPAFLPLSVISLFATTLSTCERTSADSISENLDNRINNLTRDIEIHSISAKESVKASCAERNKEHADGKSKDSIRSQGFGTAENRFEVDIPEMPDKKGRGPVYVKKSKI